MPDYWIIVAENETWILLARPDGSRWKLGGFERHESDTVVGIQNLLANSLMLFHLGQTDGERHDRVVADWVDVKVTAEAFTPTAVKCRRCEANMNRTVRVREDALARADQAEDKYRRLKEGHAAEIQRKRAEVRRLMHQFQWTKAFVNRLTLLVDIPGRKTERDEIVLGLLTIYGRPFIEHDTECCREHDDNLGEDLCPCAECYDKRCNRVKPHALLCHCDSVHEECGTLKKQQDSCYQCHEDAYTTTLCDVHGGMMVDGEVRVPRVVAMERLELPKLDPEHNEYGTRQPAPGILDVDTDDMERRVARLEGWLARRFGFQGDVGLSPGEGDAAIRQADEVISRADAIKNATTWGRPRRPEPTGDEKTPPAPAPTEGHASPRNPSVLTVDPKDCDHPEDKVVVAGGYAGTVRNGRICQQCGTRFVDD